MSIKSKYTLTDFHPRKGPLPDHVGLIPDGGRTWAKINQVSLLDTYTISVEKVAKHIGYFFEKGVNTITIYHSSVQNYLNRLDLSQVMPFITATEIFCEKHLPKIISKYEPFVKVCGRLDVVPSEFSNLLTEINTVDESTATRKINALVSYNPLEENFSAISQSESPSTFINHLWVTEPLDLVIRTSGFNVISNFLPLQSGFSRLYFVDKLYNDLETSDLEAIFIEFSKRERKFGD
jgi:tritrans,polycis-undecaprenyl-diphosphate synthase [geranylgeranyl-diphosphate specific]